MAIKSNLPSLAPSRERFKREITLLSKGFSDPAWAGGLITVYPWDSSTDDFLLERSKKRRDTVIFDILPKLCNLNGGDVNNFVVSEVTTILLVARSIARENKLNLNLKCPECQHEWQDELIVPDQLEKVGEKPDSYPGWDLITLPCTDVVKVRPLLIRDELAIMGRPDRSVSDRVAHTVTSIISINDSKPDDTQELLAWQRALPPKDADFLFKKLNLLTPHLSTQLSIDCPKCQHEWKHIFPLDENFFRPSLGTP